MRTPVSIKLLRLSLGIFFVVLGIVGVLPGVQESVFSLNDRHGLEVIFGIVEIICGLILIVGLFTMLKRKTLKLASLVVLAFWGVRVVFTKFVWGLSISNKGIFFIPQFSTWLLVLCCELVIAAGLYTITRAYD